MADREKVKKGLENCLKGFDCPPECPYLHDCHDLMKPMFVELAKDAYDLLKEQEGTINELQNAYGYLQKQCFEAQDKLLKEQEAVPVVQREVLNMMYVWCCGSCGVAITDGDKYCRMCGKEMKWE